MTSVLTLKMKDTLSADIRVETERNLRSLEADLRTAEQKRKERAMAVKYHKVKFFGELNIACILCLYTESTLNFCIREEKGFEKN